MIKIILWLVALAFFHAWQEIQIEGREGWARKLPTFRINVFFNQLLGGKPLTGYHLFMLLMFVTIFHGLYLENPWSWFIEAKVFGLLYWYFVLEDFLWFVFNKHYGLKKFKKGRIPWHSRWAFGLPVTYWWGMIIGSGLLLIGSTQ